MRRRQARARVRDAGFTLVELMASMGIFALLLALLSGVVIEMLKANTGTRERLANIDQVRIGMDAMSRALRTAVRPEQLNSGCTAVCDYAFESIDDEHVTFYANLGDDDAAGSAAPSRVSYAIGADPDDPTGTTAVVTETRQRVAPGWSSGDYVFVAPCTVGGPAVAGCTSRAVTTGIRWPYPATETPFAFRGVDGAAALPAGTNVDAVAAVDITLPVGSEARPSASVSSTVFLPNSTLGR